MDDTQVIHRHHKQLQLTDGVLFKMKKVADDREFRQLVLPQSHRREALRLLHDETGHLGVERTLDRVSSRFYWPCMVADVEQKCWTCERCAQCKRRAQKSAPLVNIRTTAPMELVCMDFQSLEPDNKNTTNIHFTRYAQAFPTRILWPQSWPWSLIIDFCSYSNRIIGQQQPLPCSSDRRGPRLELWLCCYSLWIRKDVPHLLLHNRRVPNQWEEPAAVQEDS